MAPRKRKNEGEEKAKPETASLRVTRSMVRQTRSSTQRADAKSAGSATKFVKLESPKKRKTKKAMGAGAAAAAAAAAAAKKKGKQGEEAAETKVEEEIPAADDGTAANELKKKTIVVEHCKQCNSFKTRAIQVKEGLEEGVPGITVVLNPEKPRRGCFEIREEGGKTFVSLLDMKRPFAPMKALDMKEVIADIIEKIE